MSYYPVCTQLKVRGYLVVSPSCIDTIFETPLHFIFESYSFLYLRLKYLAACKSLDQLKDLL